RHTTMVSDGSADVWSSELAVTFTEGATHASLVATFTDADPLGTATDYTATITWGDGSTTSGTITSTGSVFSVSGTHTYAEEGTEIGSAPCRATGEDSAGTD